MNASEPIKCRRCGTAHAVQTSFDLCPRCLLGNALAMGDEPCPYQVIAPIDEDAGGITYLAQGITRSHRQVALKIHGWRDDTEQVMSRYQRWKPVLARVRQRSASTLLDVGLTADGFLYQASEYVPGWPLSALESHSVGMTDRKELARQLTAALDDAHAAGVVHLKLDTSKVKISTASSPHATILGLGSGLVVDGLEGSPDVDRLALTRILHQLNVSS
jgi:hypothetical protein